jgi:methylated-DNA-[protein]-cysteine S-methyltransferase
MEEKNMKSKNKKKEEKSFKTSFKDRVFEVTKKIPKGKTLTYKEVAKLVGSPKAFRAVGTVLASNFDPKIPCHRVIRSDGRIGNYNRGGSEAKTLILRKEKAIK